jgi:hypothetical protein
VSATDRARLEAAAIARFCAIYFLLLGIAVALHAPGWLQAVSTGFLVLHAVAVTLWWRPEARG